MYKKKSVTSSDAGMSRNKIFLACLLAQCLVLPCSSVRPDSSHVVWVNITSGDLPVYCQYCTCLEVQNHTDMIYTDCSDIGLFVVPRLSNRTSIFIFQKNLLKRVRYKYFSGLSELRYLDLSKNTISTIDIGAFRDLSKLETLRLNGNNFGSFKSVLKPGVFKGLEGLQELYLHNSIDFRVAKIMNVLPYGWSKDLVGLQTLSIDGVTNVTFNSHFRVLGNLTSLTLSGVQGTCEIENLSYDSFEGLPHLLNLTLEKCDLTSISPYTFSSLKHLRYLDLSWNMDVEFKQFGKVAEGLVYTNISVLKINAIHNPYRAGTEILRQDVRYIRELKLSELHMDDNGIEYIDYGVFDYFSGQLPKTLKKLYMRKNRLHFGLYMNEVVFNYRNLEVFDAGNQEIVVRWNDYHSEDFLKNINKRMQRSGRTMRDYSDGGMQHLFKRNIDDEPVIELSLEKLICSRSMSGIQPLDFRNTINNISLMDLSANFLPEVKTGAFDGLGALNQLDLSGNYIENIRTDGFRGLIAVTSLDLENNLLGNALTIDSDGVMFAPMKSLKTLNISRNRITNMNKDVFKNVHYLEVLDLSDNHISDFKADLSSLHSLQLLNLSNNRIASLSNEVMKTLGEFANYHNVSVDLRENKLTCNCETMQFLKQLIGTKVKFIAMDQYYCSLNDGTVRYLNSTWAIVQALESECQSFTLVIVFSTVAASCIVNSIVIFIVYKKRWNLRYLYYMAKVKLDINIGEFHEDPRYPFDIFVSYGDGDREFVTQKMIEHLELSKGIRLNIRDRDFEIGEAIAVNISKAIHTSKKTFLLISKHFLRNKWCNFEMNMARMEQIHKKRKTLVIVFLEQLPTKVLPLQIIDLLTECPQIDLPKENDHMTAFWEECASFTH